jgi:hypothetical protein
VLTAAFAAGVSDGKLKSGNDMLDGLGALDDLGATDVTGGREADGTFVPSNFEREADLRLQ